VVVVVVAVVVTSVVGAGVGVVAGVVEVAPLEVAVVVEIPGAK